MEPFYKRPWSKDDYPHAMKNLPEEVRNKAIEIGNALLDENKEMEEGVLISTAIEKAKEWDEKRKREGYRGRATG